MAVINFRNNEIAVRKTGGKPRLYINGKRVEVEEYVDEPNPYRSKFAYLPAVTLEELGQSIVDEQAALDEATLPGFQPS